MIKKIFGAVAGATLLPAAVMVAWTVHTADLGVACGKEIVREAISEETEGTKKVQRLANETIDCGAYIGKLFGYYTAGTIGAVGAGGIGGWMLAGRWGRRPDGPPNEPPTTGPS